MQVKQDIKTFRLVISQKLEMRRPPQQELLRFSCEGCAKAPQSSTSTEILMSGACLPILVMLKASEIPSGLWWGKSTWHACNMLQQTGQGPTSWRPLTVCVCELGQGLGGIVPETLEEQVETSGQSRLDVSQPPFVPKPCAKHSKGKLCQARHHPMLRATSQ